MKFKEMQADVQAHLKPSRYRHTMGVVETAVLLAKCYDCPKKEAKRAALLHDCAKYLTDEEKIAMCREYGVAISDAELEYPALLHAKCGAILAKERYGITDPGILHAIQVHTTGVPAMNLLDQIIFVSDYIEPNRDQAPHLPQLRALAQEDLEETVYLILKDTVEYLNSRKDQTMDPTTLAAYDYYRKQHEKRHLKNGRHSV